MKSWWAWLRRKVLYAGKRLGGYRPPPIRLRQQVRPLLRRFACLLRQVPFVLREKWAPLRRAMGRVRVKLPLRKNAARLGAVTVLAVAGIVLLVSVPRRSPDPPPGRRQTRIGVLVVNKEQEGRFAGFRAEMEHRGYVEGAPLRYLNPGPLNSDSEMVRDAARRVIDAKVNVILALGTQAAQVVNSMAEEASIPLVFTSQNPISAGIVKTYRHYGCAITGLADERSMGRRLQLLLTISPTIKILYIPYNAGDIGPVNSFSDLCAMMMKCGIEWVARPVHNESDLRVALDSMPHNAQAVFVLPDALVASHMDKVVEAALLRRIPVCGPGRFSAEKGALMAYGPDFAADSRALARLVDQILQGVDPRDLPVEVSHSVLVVNCRTAARLNLPLPDEILNQADVVIE